MVLNKRPCQVLDKRRGCCKSSNVLNKRRGCCASARVLNKYHCAEQAQCGRGWWGAPSVMNKQSREPECSESTPSSKEMLLCLQLIRGIFLKSDSVTRLLMHGMINNCSCRCTQIEIHHVIFRNCNCGQLYIGLPSLSSMLFFVCACSAQGCLYRFVVPIQHAIFLFALVQRRDVYPS